MLYLTAGGATGDPVALLMVLVLALIVAVMAVRKHLARGRAAQAAPAAAPVRPAEPPKTAPGSAGKLKLHGVEPKTAAMLMAIVADKMGRPLNELRFLSIKEVKE